MANKVLVFIFVLLLIIVAAELGYFFYYQPKVKNQPLPTPSVKLRPQNQLKGETYLLSLVPKSKTNQDSSIDGIAYLKRENPSLQCLLTSNCIEIDNEEDVWSQHNASSTAIDITTPFVVRISLENKNELAGISLNGKINSPPSQWWEDVYSVFIGLKDDGNRLYIDARNGASPDAFGLLEKELENVTVLNIFFDKNGKHVLIADEKYQVLAYLDVNKITDNQFPNGLFPDKKMYLGVGVAPKSYLALLEFSIIPIAD